MPSESWRLLTIVFVDVVGSTPLSVLLDGEDYADLIDAYQAVSKPVMERHGGFLGRDEGDGRLIWFGWPRAAEDDAVRAVRMSVEMSEAIQVLAKDVTTRLGVDLAVRIGVHTGEIIVRQSAETEKPALIGAAANVAAKVQAAAAAGEVYISEATAALVENEFALRPAGQLGIDGLDGHVELFSVSAAVASSSIGHDVIGRRAERSRLADQWRAVRAGGSAAVMITGEPGIGKSQLVAGFLDSFSGDARRLEITADNYRQNESFGVLADALRKSDLDTPDTLIEDLLHLNRRASAIDLLLGAIRHRAAGGPFVIVAEDLHWLDHSTADVLSEIAAAAIPSVLLLTTSRLTAASLVKTDDVLTIGLGPLEPGDLERLILRQGPDLDADDRQAIAQQSAGNPFFATALIQSRDQANVSGSRRALLPHSEVPIVVQQALRGQLDRRPSGSDLAVTAAVLGREFDEELLRRCHVPSESFEADLAWLQEARLLEPTGNGLRFRHALVQQLAYDLPVREDRRACHSRVADGLVAVGNASASVLGLHYDRAGRAGEAIEAKLEAAQLCRGAGAFRDGLEELDRAVALIESNEDCDRATELEVLELRSVIATVVGEASYGANAFDRQRLTSMLSEEDDPTALTRALTRDWGSAMVMSDLRRGGGILRRLNRLSRGDEVSDAVARLFRGTHMMYRGNVRYAEPQLQRAALDLLELGLQPEFRANWSTADDPVSVGLSRLPALLWMRGKLDAAEAMLQLAQDEASTIAGPAAAMSAAHVKANAALFYEQVGDGRRAIEIGAEITAIGTEPSLAFWEQNGQLHQLIGGVLLEPTTDRLKTLLEAARSLEGVARLFAPMLYLETARGHLRSGNQTAALEAVEGAATVARETGARWLWSETLRLRAASLDSGSEQVELLTEAAETAWRQGSRVYGLRALADLLETAPTAEVTGVPVLDQAERALADFPSLDRYDEVSRLVDLIG